MKQDIVSKYEQREKRSDLENIYQAQFVKMYEPAWTGPTRKKNQVASLITCNYKEIDIYLHSSG